MGDMADYLTDSMLDTIAMGGYCPECGLLCDPQGACGCDDTGEDLPKRKKKETPCR